MNFTEVRAGQIYRHWKGGRYLVLGVGEDANNDRKYETTVYYCSIDPGPKAGQWRSRLWIEWIAYVETGLMGRATRRFELETS